ncbi:MSHA biogenesis protein MshI [Teredinibacter turnerae]|uniref:MSHA biogenesis protein MshI n=1 Tax=Teredinibacter turnerae TaxID=2426 RepID=UPI0030CE0B79
MAIQQINLYLPELRPSRDWLSLNTLLVSVAGTVLLFIISYIYGNWASTRLREQVAVVEQQVSVARNQLAQTRTKARPLHNASLDTQAAYLEAAIRGREQVGQIISGQSLGNSGGFTAAFNALALHSSPSVALGHIRLTRGGAYLQLAGATNSPEDVTIYLQHLRDDPAFGSTRFGLLSIGDSKQIRGAHRFSLGFESVYDDATDGAEQ